MFEAQPNQDCRPWRNTEIIVPNDRSLVDKIPVYPNDASLARRSISSVVLLDNGGVIHSF